MAQSADAELSVPISADGDVVTARQLGRALAAEVGFGATDITRIATAISEIARNIIQYAHRGVIRLARVRDGAREGILVVSEDEGPGIADIKRAMQDGYTTGGGLGLGLPGARRLMDDFDVQSVVGKGTTITMRKWRA
jgi:serine/threonine-protein kinase RsbT